ncbi:unnamed protein product, partial [Phaeothamnion confervicola]
MTDGCGNSVRLGGTDDNLLYLTVVRRMGGQFGRRISSAGKKRQLGVMPGPAPMLILEDAPLSETAGDEQRHAQGLGMSEEQRLHEALGHPSASVMERMDRLGLIKLRKPFKLPFCDACQYGKSHREAANKNSPERAKQLFELVHSDMLGPITPATQSGYKYAIIFVDDLTRFRVVYLMRTKDEAAQKLQDYIGAFVTPRNLRIQRLRTDNGSEYRSSEFEHICKTNGYIKMECSAPYTQSQNGVSERSWRTEMEKARTMLYASGLPRNFWGHALLHANYLTNITPTTADVLGETCPAAAFSGRQPEYSGLQPFGCPVFVHEDKQAGRTKLDPKARRGFFLGLATKSKTSLIYMPDTKTVLESTHTTFDPAGTRLGEPGSDFTFPETATPLERFMP